MIGAGVCSAAARICFSISPSGFLLAIAIAGNAVSPLGAGAGGLGNGCLPPARRRIAKCGWSSKNCFVGFRCDCSCFASARGGSAIWTSAKPACRSRIRRNHSADDLRCRAACGWCGTAIPSFGSNWSISGRHCAVWFRCRAVTSSGQSAARPVRAIFFFFFGLEIDPTILVPALPFAVGLGAVTTLTKVLTGYWATRRAGIDSRGRLRAGVELVARGEFSIVIAGLGVAIEPRLGPLSAAYVLIMAMLGPLLARLAR